MEFGNNYSLMEKAANEGLWGLVGRRPPTRCVWKLEIRNPKSETNSNEGNPKFKTPRRDEFKPFGL
jgi:hypothetical protein